MKCRYRFVFPDGHIEEGQQIGDPDIIDAAARLAGAMGVTVMVLA